MHDDLSAAAPPRGLVVNADDFGASVGINRGVIEAHVTGPVTSTSLMVNMPAAADAVERAAEHPRLALGLHVNFTNEDDPVVPDEDFRACRRELQNQVDTFVGMVGRRPTHLDSHHNVHLHQPALSELFAEMADELQIPLRGSSGVPYVSSFYGQWDGESHPEQLTVESLLAIIDAAIANDPIIEFACHPGYVDPAFRSVYHQERELELATLCAPAVMKALTDRKLSLLSFADIAARTFDSGDVTASENRSGSVRGSYTVRSRRHRD